MIDEQSSEEIDSIVSRGEFELLTFKHGAY